MNHYERAGHRTVVFRLRESLLPVLSNCDDKPFKGIFAQQKSEIHSHASML